MKLQTKLTNSISAVFGVIVLLLIAAWVASMVL